MPRARRGDLFAQRRRIGQGVDHVVLVPVQRLQRDDHALRLGVGSQLTERVEQDLGVFGLGTGTLERWQALAEHPVRGRRHGESATDLGHDRELGLHLAQRVSSFGGVEVADEVQHLHAHGWHRHPGRRRLLELRQPRGEAALTGGAQLEGIKPELLGVLPTSVDAVSPRRYCSWADSRMACLMSRAPPAVRRGPPKLKITCTRSAGR